MSRRRAVMPFGMVLGTFCLFTHVGCDDTSTKTGTTVEKAPGQDAGEKASQDAMKAMMKGQPKK